MEEKIDIKAKTIKVDTGKGNTIKVTMSYGVYCTIKIPKVAEGNPKSCMRIFPIIADVFGISLRPQ